MINQKNTSLLTFFPRFLKGLKDIINLSKSTDIKINQLLNKFDSLERMKKIVNGDLTDEEVELSLWERHVDYFDKTLTKAQKIQLINTAKKAHREKGTRATLDKLLNIIFGELQLQEWFEAGLEPYHFHIMTSASISDDVLIRINRTVEEYAPTRCIFEGVKVNKNYELQLYESIAVHNIEENIIRIDVPSTVINAIQGIAIQNIEEHNIKIGIVDNLVDTLESTKIELKNSIAINNIEEEIIKIY